jgi:hypothetical protein
MCLNPLHVSGVKRPSSGGTTHEIHGITRFVRFTPKGDKDSISETLCYILGKAQIPNNEKNYNNPHTF